jgi:hypothetical protein
VSYTYARQRYPNAEIHGNGDHGCISRCRVQVHIELGSEQFVKDVSRGPCGKSCSFKHTVERMFETPCPNLKDDWEDRARERHEKRVQEQRLREN